MNTMPNGINGNPSSDSTIENKLVEPKELWQELPFGMICLDLRSHILHMNPQAESLLGPAKVLIDQPFHGLCVDDLAMDGLMRSLAAGSRQTFDLVLKKHPSEHIDVRIYPIVLNAHRILVLQDLNEIRALEEELRNFKIAIEAADDAIFLFDKDGLIFYINAAFEKQVGFLPEQILGRNLEDFWSAHVPPVVFTDLWQCINRGVTWAGELKCICRDRYEFDVEVRITPIHDGRQNIAGFICVQRDITHRKSLEQQLAHYSDDLEKRVEERTITLAKLHEISQLFHTTNTREKLYRLILIAATAGEAFQFNRAFLLLVNEDSDELIGKMAIGPSDPKDAGDIWHLVAQLPRKGSLSDILKVYLDNPGKGDGHVNWIVQQLSTSMANRQSILVQAIQKGKSIIVHHGKANSDYYPPLSQLLGCDNFAVIPLLLLDYPIGVLVVDNAITCSPIMEENIKMLEILAMQGALAIAHANTQEELAQKVKETEKAYSELRHSQKQLVESSKFAALGQMAATVAHEIRTPLVAIGGFANMLLKKQDPTDRNYNYLTIIRDEALRLEDVLNRLLFYAKPSTPFLEKNDLNEHVENILSFMKDEISFHEINVEVHLAPDLPSFFFDRNLIRQVFINLVQNAVQAMKNGGTLNITTANRGDWAELSIHDEGTGIPEDQIDRIFEAFYSTKHAGTGLGLHVSKRIIASHGGKIEVTSQIDKGTMATIWLPLRKENSDEKNSGH